MNCTDQWVSSAPPYQAQTSISIGSSAFKNVFKASIKKKHLLNLYYILFFGLDYSFKKQNGFEWNSWWYCRPLEQTWRILYSPLKCTSQKLMNEIWAKCFYQTWVRSLPGLVSNSLSDSKMLLRLEWSEDDNSLSVVYIIADFYWQPDNSLLNDSLMFTLLLLDDC